MKDTNKKYEIIDNKLYIFLEEITFEEIESWQLDATKITELHSDSLKHIDDKAFFKFANLTIIDLPNVESISYNVFSGVKSLDHINMPKLSYAQNDSFNYDSLPDITIINEALFKYQTKDECVHLDNVTQVFPRAFFKNKYIKNVSFPKATEIGIEAFAGCLSLESIDFPNVTQIDDRAFVGCCNLQKIDIPKLEEISSNGEIFTTEFLPDELILGKVLFKYQKNVADYQNDAVTIVASSAFQNNKYIKHIKLNNVTTIGDNAFYGAVNLETLELKSYDCSDTPGYQDYYLDAFLKYNFSLKEIKLSSNHNTPNIYFDWEYTSLPDIAYINSTLFKCTSRDETYIDKKALYVADGAFKNNMWIKKIHLEKATSCAADAFYKSFALEEIHIPNWNEPYNEYALQLLISPLLPINEIEIPRFSNELLIMYSDNWSAYKCDEFIIGNTLVFYKGQAKEYYNEDILCFSGPILKEAANLEKIHLPNLKRLTLNMTDDCSDITKLKEFIIDNEELDERQAKNISEQLMVIPSLQKIQINQKYKLIKEDGNWKIINKY
ncbi:leucine-rich repeat protein [Mycoplasma sp. 48589B]